MAIRIEIVGDSAEEILYELKSLTANLKKQQDEKTTKPAPEPKRESENVDPKQFLGSKNDNEPPKAEEPISAVTAVTLEELRKLAVDRSRAFGNKAVKEILQNYGVDKITDLRPEAYDLVYADLEAMA